MPDSSPPSPAGSSTSSRSLALTLSLLGPVTAVIFAIGIGDAPFVDEYAYITQSYQPDLLIAGRSDDPRWLEFLSFDLVPLPKYLINGAFRVAGTPRPSPRDAAAWYHNTSYRWGSMVDLQIARFPAILCAIVGCLSLCWLVGQAFGLRSGIVAAIFLAWDPLYRLHAHRAMSEAPCEGFLILSLAIGLVAWKSWWNPGKRRWVAGLLWIASGASAGLSMLAKFNGLLALFTLVAWAVLGLATASAAGLGRKARLVAGTALSILAAATIFVMLNPFMTARPRGVLPEPIAAVAKMGMASRFRFLVDQRRETSRNQQQMFPHNALLSLPERARVVAVQGCGRFGLLGPTKSDSTVRYDLHQDAGAFLWIPLVLIGLGRAVVRGARQLAENEPPAGWALVLWTVVTLTVVTVYLPMAWDRYLLPIQAPFAALAAVPVDELLAYVSRRPAASS